MLFNRPFCCSKALLWDIDMPDKSMSLSDFPVRIMGKRPTESPTAHPVAIPADATIYNARRPLFGTLVDEVGLTWRSEVPGAGGRFFAAVLADDPNAPSWHQKNHDLGAFVVEYVSVGQVRLATAARYGWAYLMAPADVVSTLDSDQALWLKYMASGLDRERVLA